MKFRVKEPADTRPFFSHAIRIFVAAEPAHYGQHSGSSPCGPPARAKAAKKLRPPPACSTFVTAKHPKQIAALRMRSEVLTADPLPIRRSVAGTRKASAAEIQECLAFAGYANPIISKIAARRLPKHLRACGMVVMRDDA